MTGAELVGVGLAGGVGAAARAVLDDAVTGRRPGPLGVLAVNVLGSLLLGVLVGGELFRGWDSRWVLFGGTGFCGGFTTFSTVAVLSVRLGRGERGLRAATGYLLLTLVTTVLAATVGLLLTGW